MLTGKPSGKRLLGSPRRKWEDNITMDLKKIGINTKKLVDWAQCYQDYQDYRRVLVNAALNFRVQYYLDNMDLTTQILNSFLKYYTRSLLT